jgi:hypothetical protein
MAALLLLLTGRPAALTQLSGTGAAELAATYPARAEPTRRLAPHTQPMR